jgi:plastocyanin
VKNPFRIPIVAATLFCAAIVQSSSAATANVAVGLGGLHFSPVSVSISVNDSVVWNWTNAFHSSTSGTNGVHGEDNGTPCGLWDTGVIGSLPHSFTNVFTTNGIFDYYCSPHASAGMTGQVLVASASLPPSLAITNPSNGAVFAEPANVTIEATVTNGSGPVTNVQFLINGTVQASENSGPFSTVANSLTAGGYTLSAIARDINGLSATNSVDISVVTPVDVSLMNASKSSGTEFQFSYSANIGLNYVVLKSPDLTSWIPLITNTAASNPVVFDDVNATNSLDFYRVGRLPNP